MIVFVIAAILVLLLFALFYASYSISAGVYLKAICKLNTTEKAVALTYDDGPEIGTTPLVLDVLRKHRVKACFFCIGEKAEQSPQIVKRMYAEGHLIGNHSYSHENKFPVYNKKRMMNDLLKSKQILEQIAGEEILLFRPPFGVTNLPIGKVVSGLGLKTIGWSLRSLDTQATSADEVLERIKKKLKPRDIILLHDRMPFAAELTDKLLIYLKENGWSVKSVI